MTISSIWLLLFATAAWAQNSHPKNAGQQTIVLPLELVAAQPATLMVLTLDGRVAPGVKVVLSSGEVVATDESGRAHFLAPPSSGLMFARIPGTEVCEAADVLPRTSRRDSLQLARAPKAVPVENRFAIGGSGFQGDADRNRVEIGGKAILVLASSPVELIVKPPANAPLGTANLRITEGTTEVAIEITLVDVISDASSAQIRRGKKAKIVLHAAGTNEPLTLQIRNLSPQVVQFPHGDVVRAYTSGGSDNSTAIPVKGVSAGTFSFTIDLENNQMPPNASVAWDLLAAAQKIAKPDIAKRIGTSMKEPRRGNIDALKVRNDLLDISSQGEAGNFQALIRAALRAMAGE